MMQLEFNLKEGRRRRDEGTKKALSHEGVMWYRLADHYLDILISIGKPFTSEDLIQRAGMPPPDVHPSAVGAIFNAASRKRRIMWTGNVAQASRPSCHAALLKVWMPA